MIKILGVIIFTLPLILAIASLPATIMLLAAPSEKGFYAKLFPVFAILILTYFIPYIIGLKMVFSTEKLCYFTIPLIHILLTLSIYFITDYIENQEKINRINIVTTIEGVLNETYNNEISMDMNNSFRKKSRLFDKQDKNHFWIQYTGVNKNNISEAIKSERSKKNDYININTRLVESIAGYVDDYVIVESEGNIVQLYSYINLDYLYYDKVKHIEKIIELAQKLLRKNDPIKAMCYMNLQVKPKYAKAGFMAYDYLDTEESLDKRTIILMEKSAFLLTQTGNAMSNNYFANRYGIVPMMIKNIIPSFSSERLNLTITNGFLDYIDQKLVLRGDYANNTKQITGKYMYHFADGDIYIEN